MNLKSLISKPVLPWDFSRSQKNKETTNEQNKNKLCSRTMIYLWAVGDLEGILERRPHANCLPQMELESFFSRQNPIKCLEWIGSLVVWSLHITLSMCVFKIDLSWCFPALIEILTIFVLQTLISVPSVYQKVTELHRQLSICNCSLTREYFRSINDAFERIHNEVSLKFRFSNDSDYINVITQYGEKIKSVTNVKSPSLCKSQNAFLKQILLLIVCG